MPHSKTARKKEARSSGEVLTSVKLASNCHDLNILDLNFSDLNFSDRGS